jgi:hypothetical protein
VVNTHADGDHWNGDLYFEDARIFASQATISEMKDMWPDPARLSSMANGGTAFGRFVSWRTAAYDHAGWYPVYPIETFSGASSIRLDGQPVELFGPVSRNRQHATARSYRPAQSAGPGRVHSLVLGRFLSEEPEQVCGDLVGVGPAQAVVGPFDGDELAGMSCPP